MTPPILMILGVPFEQWIDSSGFLVETVEPGSAADRAGLQGGDWPVIWGGTQYLIGGDIITHVDGVRVTDLASTLQLVRGLTVGQEVTVTWQREGEQMEATVVLQERPTLPADLEQYRLR
ncbi:PDZ domain-containing protein [Albidovulum sediminis]|uniref:PDZ domain-containing protein n=1 Tax=Albidovulum sediminis TaxID=3066345 RepID=UPI0021C0598F